MTDDHVIIVPGDKSITHRALLLAGVARGECRLVNPLASLDTRSTARVLRGLGASVGPLGRGSMVRIRGRGRFRVPSGVLHCGNSGTTARLLLGMLAAHPFETRLTGDRSLRRRPMRRVTEPLALMGARFRPDSDQLPLTIRGGSLRPLRWSLPISSAQVKSAILLAGVVGRVPVAVQEPTGRSRDHTERMLSSLGFRLTTDSAGWIELASGGTVPPFDLQVPGDVSSAAFLIGAALLVGRPIVIGAVGLNPTRLGYLDVLRRMGASIEVSEETRALGEPVGSIRVEPADLRAARVIAAEVPGLIDEIPLLAVLAARAAGETRFEEVGELRVKESDRLRLIAANLARLGIEASGERNTLIVRGTERPPVGRVTTDGDHRLAMAFSALGRVPGARVVVDDRASAEVSFPGFFPLLDRVTGRGVRWRR